MGILHIGLPSGQKVRATAENRRERQMSEEWAQFSHGDPLRWKNLPPELEKKRLLKFEIHF
jgi:hypothetical protein